MEARGYLFWHVVYRARNNNGRPAYAEHVPIYVHNYFIRCAAAEYAIPKPDGNLTRLSSRVSLGCETIFYQHIYYLAYACCMKPGCSEKIQSVSPHRAARNTSLLHHSLLTTYYHTDTMLTSSLDVLHTLWCTLVCRNSVKLNFVKTGLKFEFGVNPQSFSHELCLYITRFVRLGCLIN